MGLEIEQRLLKAQSANSLLADLFDFHISVYGLRFLEYKHLPTVEVKGVHKNLNILEKDTNTTSRLNCCQCLGYPNVYFAWTSDTIPKLAYAYPIGSMGDVQLATFNVDKTKVEEQILSKMIKETDVELFQDLFNAGIITHVKFENSQHTKNIYSSTSWSMAFSEDIHNSIPNKEEFIKILEFWQEKFGKDFHFWYSWDKDKLTNFKLHFDTFGTKTGKKRMTAIELGRVPFCTENICSSLMYLIETQYGIIFKEPLMGYWFSNMYLHQSEIEKQYLTNFGPNTNSVYYGYAVSYSDIKHTLQKIHSGNSVQGSFKGERTGDSAFIETGACKRSNLWTIPSSMSSLHINISMYLRNNSKKEFFLDDNMEIFSIKHFWNCLLNLLFVNQDDFVELVKKI